VDYENSRSQIQRDDLWNWFKITLLPVIARGQLWIIGTRYHPDDLYGRLMNPEFYKKGMPFLREKAIQDDGSALWEEFYPIELLESLRAEMSIVDFGAQYQNDAEAMKGSIFKFEWFKRYRTLPKNLRRYQGVDLAIGEKDADCYFAIVTIGLDRDSNIYVLGEFRDRLDLDAQYNTIKAQYAYYDKSTSPVMKVGIESNQFQAALARKVIKSTMVPVKEVHHHRDKVTRAQRVQPHVKNGKVFFPMQGTEILEQDLVNFAPDNFEKKDVADAFMTACEVAGKGAGGPSRVKRTPRPLL